MPAMEKMTFEGWRMLPLLLFLVIRFHVVLGQTDSRDAVALQALLSGWQNAPPSWGTSNDPCGTPWEGVTCAASRVTTLKLSTMGIKGTLSSDIALLSELQSMDLSYNKDLGGTLTSNIGNLQKLTTLILLGCNFSGTVPSELGDLPLLTYISLNSNKFTGSIPPSLGKLSNLYWLDLADNQLSGTLPISSGTSPGLDQLLNTKHFHFNKNKLTGTIPAKLFSSDMTLLHVLFDSNQLTGTIPETVGLVKSLEVLRLDRNRLTGLIPSNISNLTAVNELNLASNQLSGTIPDLSGMTNLNYLDLSNNTFSPSDTPNWFTQIPSLTTLAIESGNIQGELPNALFSLPQLQQVLLKNNSFNGTLDITGTISPQLQLVDLEGNEISSITPEISSQITLMLAGNPICSSPPTSTKYCLQQQIEPAYSTSLAKCATISCSQDASVDPANCACAFPYKGIMTFRAPSFSDLINSTRFQSLETSLWTVLGLAPGSVYLSNVFFNSDKYLDMQVALFPSHGEFFNRSEIQRLGFYLSNQTYKPPTEFGPFVFIASPYTFEGANSGKSNLGSGAIAGIVVSCAVLFIGLVFLGLYAFKQKKKAERATELSKPFASWGPAGKDAGGAPQLKGARWFSFDDLKKCTRNFSESNEIGDGGYGKVYKGTLPNGQVVAIKRSQKGSMQGGLEFKTEIELLSRVHHKNLVGLVGFCFEQEEKMLVYEFVPKGTLRDNMTGKTDSPLDWKRRLKIALGSARGLAYLHDLADPPIIHRDVKSTNILLDDDLNAKVADFGLSKLVADSEKGYISTQVKGTLGYLDPEYYMTQQLTDKSDVYSFGVVMLELVTSKLPIEKGKYIVREVKLALNKRDYEHYGLTELIDPVIRSSNLIGFARFVDLALQCVENESANRPRMSEVVKEIEIMLMNESSNPTSASSSATEFARPQGQYDHLYKDQLASNMSSGAFDNSTGYTFEHKIEPK